MLSRTADHLFWMARYMERAENTARMLDVNYQTSLLPQSAARAEQGWRGLLSISELTGPFQQKFEEVNERIRQERQSEVEGSIARQHLIDGPRHALRRTHASVVVLGLGHRRGRHQGVTILRR